MTPARRHKHAVLAQHVAKDELAALYATSDYQKLLYSLKQDQLMLKRIQSIQDKVKTKAEMLPAYAAWVEGVIAAGQLNPDDQITPTILIWMIDTGNIDGAMPLIRFALEHNMPAADAYERTMCTIIFEETAERLSAGAGISYAHLDDLCDRVAEKSENGLHKYDMPDQVRAKFLKAAGEIYQAADNKQKACALYERALNYDSACGVKTKLRQVSA